MTNATSTPSEDPNLVRWTPQDGPLAEALDDLPDGHPVTIRDQQGQLLHGIKTTVPKLDMAPYVRAQFGTETWWLDESNSITSASWLPAAPPSWEVRWTPQDGPLAEALAGLPDGHPVTIAGPGVHLEGFNVRSASEQGFRWKLGHTTRYIWSDNYAGVTSASWLPPAPAWDGAPVVLDNTDDLLWRGVDGLYRSGAVGASYAFTAAELEQQYGPIRVLIDADGNHVEVPHA